MSNTDMINGLMSGSSPIDNFTEYLLYLKKMQTKVHPLLHRARVRGSALEKYNKIITKAHTSQYRWLMVAVMGGFSVIMLNCEQF